MDDPSLPPRPADGHKGTFGTVCVIGGHASSPRMMIGGPALAARGAFRVGCGCVILVVPAPIATAALGMMPSATALPLSTNRDGRLDPSAAAEAIDSVLPSVDAIVIGPGLGLGDPQRRLVARMIGFDAHPLVVDADAITALAELSAPQEALRAPAILTPHPGEWRRLAAALGIEGDPTDAARRGAAATTMAQRLGAIVVLKGARTIVSDGLREWVSPHENPALAAAGTGDVLAGAIAGLVAQSSDRTAMARADLFDAARLGVLLHAEAGALWSTDNGDAGMLATELADLLPRARRARSVMESASSSAPAS